MNPHGRPGFRLCLDEAFLALLDEMRLGADERFLARRFHRTMAEAIVRGAERLAEEAGTRRVALGGGVFQNQLLLAMVVDGLAACGLEALLPREVPANDGGISYGQLPRPPGSSEGMGDTLTASEVERCV